MNGERSGDVSYITMHVRDSLVAREFYGHVLGWEFEHGRIEDGWGPSGVSTMFGLSGGHESELTWPMYRVDDIGEAVARVRLAGGSATDPEEQPYGWTSECFDDQGMRFGLGQH